MTQAIDGTASGETIRMAFFSLNVPRFADKLIAAHKRGVNVRLLQDDHEIGYHWLRIVAAIGSNPANRSWAMLCHKSCMSDEDPSYLHAKLYMFSRTQGVPLVVMISSANPTFTQARIGWNDLYTMTRNSTMYTGSRTHFERMTAGAIEDAAGDQSVGIPIDAYSSVASGIWKAYYFPKGGEGKDDDPMYGVMTNIGCWGAAFGYGSGGRTVIKIAMYQWSELRVRLAEKLWELDDAGCIVEVIYNPTTTDKLIIDTLRKPGGKYGAVKVTPAHEDRNADGILEHFVHNKFMLVNGVYLGYGASKIVFTGSANWTNTALHYGNEIMLKVISNSTYDAYASHYARVLAWSNSIPPPPPPTPTPGPTVTAPPSLPPTPPPTVPPTVPPSPDPSASAPPSGAPLPNLPFADFGLDLSGALPNERLPEALE